MKRVAIVTSLLLAAALSTGCEPGSPEATAPTTVTVSRTVEVDGSPVLEADGIGAVRLGMTLEQLRATGEVGPDLTMPEYSCPLYGLTTVLGWVGFQDGVAVDLRVESHARTPEDLRIGDSQQRMHEVYPDVEQNPHAFVRATDAGTRYQFIFRDAGETLTSIGLTREGYGC